MLASMSAAFFKKVVWLVLSVSWAGFAISQDSFENPFFERVTGSWVGDGELVNSEGEVTVIHEEWTGRRTDQGTYMVSGTRQMGDENQEFRWEYSFNPALDFYECEYWHTGMENPMRFEVSVTGTASELRTPFGEPGSELKVRNEFAEEGLDGHITLTNSSGQEVVTGLVKHRKES